MKLTDNIYLVGSGFIGLSNELDGHIYLIDAGTELALIDCGAGVDTEAIVENIKSDGLDPGKLSKLLLTHAHPDHAGGARWFKDNYGMKVYISSREQKLLAEGSASELGLEMALKSGGYFEGYRFKHCQAEGLNDGQSIKLGDLSLKHILTPGHSPGSACYLLDTGKRQDLFSGDTVMMNGMVGLLNCPGFSMDAYRKTARILKGLKPDGLFPGHMMFIINGGDKHVARAVKNLTNIGVPPFIGQCSP